MEDLKATIRELKSYKKELELYNLSDDMILDCSTRIFNTNIMQGKSSFPKKKKSQGRKEPLKLRNPNAPATEGQVWRLKKMGVENPEKLTQYEASLAIQEDENKKEEYPDY